MSVSVTLNGKKIKVEEGLTILQAARDNGIDIPTLCHDERLKPYGSCRVCLVKVEGARSFVPSCSTEVTEGMVIDTEDREVNEARRISLSLLISDHYGDCVSPCSLECPAHIDIQGYIALIRAGLPAEAVKLIKEKNPLPVTIGRVCPHPCESLCRRNRVDEPIAINNLKRHAADYDIALEHPYLPEREKPNGLKVALIGAGPASLSAAYYLAIKGYETTIFEKKPKPGGMLRYGIPEYRLPNRILDREIAILSDLGVEIRYGIEFGKYLFLYDLKQLGYGAVFLGIGAQLSTRLRIEGEDLPDVLSGVQFLADVAGGRPPDLSGQTVIVVGGGNTAMDASRSSLRLGADKVIVLYRRTRKEMPAHTYEITEAEEEGIEFHFLAAPVRVSAINDHLDVECIQMELGKPDSSGRRRPVPIPGSNHIMKAHRLIAAIGQRPDMSCIKDDALVGAKDLVKADRHTGATELEFVFAGGDCVTGAATAIEAIAAGRRAALSIDHYLKTGEQPEADIEEFNISKGMLNEIPDDVFELYKKASRVHTPTLPPQIRSASFDEIEHSLSEEAALYEAERCLECGCIEGFTCSLRHHSTEYAVPQDPFPGAVNRFQENNNMLSGHSPILRDENKCIKCGTCVRICDEVWGLSVYGYVHRGFETEISPSFGQDLSHTSCDFCGQCADACPTGALALNSYIPKPGPFNEKKVRGTCTYCSLGCEIDFNIHGNRILKCTAEPMSGENGGNLCVRGRFGYSYLLPGERELNHILIDGERRERISTMGAVMKTAELLKSSPSTALVVSTSLSNEEYELIDALGKAAGHSPVLHVSYDFAEGKSEIYPTVSKLARFNGQLSGIAVPDLASIEKFSALLLFNISAGRSFPILEMKIRQAVKKGLRLFIINSRPTRLDEYAEAVFRIDQSLYRDFLTLIGKVRIELLENVEKDVRTYFGEKTLEKNILSKARVNVSRILSVAEAMNGKTSAFITDGDWTASEDLHAFIMNACIQRAAAQLLVMQRGSNPVGARRWAASDGAPVEIDRTTLENYQTLLMYKLPELFSLEGHTVIDFGFKPYTSGGTTGVFFPSSSLIETGGMIHLYNDREVRLKPIILNEAGLDNVVTLRRIVDELG
jgi:formate dehydrogenase major subunit